MTNTTQIHYLQANTAGAGDNVHLSYSFPSIMLGVFTKVM